MSDVCTPYEASMLHLPYLLLMAPKVLYGASVGKSSKFPMSGHPGGPGGSGTFLPQIRRPTRYNASGKGHINDLEPHGHNPM